MDSSSGGTQNAFDRPRLGGPRETTPSLSPRNASSERRIAAPAFPQRESLASRLKPSITMLVLELTGAQPTVRSSSELRYGTHGSLSICVAGSRKGLWHDHEAGVGGGPVELIAHLRRLSAGAAVKWALAWLNDGFLLRPSITEVAADRIRPLVTNKYEFVRQLWNSGKSPSGTLAQAYLRRRGLSAPRDAPLRFHAKCRRGAETLPAMLALMTDSLTGKACGIHRTFLAADGRKAPSGPNGEPSKMMLGHAGVIRLVPDEEITLGLGIAEGIETALAVEQHFGWRPVWAASSAGAIRSFPVLPGIETLTIFADADSAGRKAALACAGRWRAAGIDVRVCTPPRGDFDDLARAVSR